MSSGNVQQFHVFRFDSIGKEYVWSIERTHNVIMMKRKEEAKTDSALTPSAIGAKLPITFAANLHRRACGTIVVETIGTSGLSPA